MGSTPEELAQENGMVHESEKSWEQPKHEVAIDYMLAVGKFEVTRAQYARFVESTNRTPSNCKIYLRTEGTWGIVDSNNWRNPGHAQTGNHPVVCVTWGDAVDYAAWLSLETGKKYRLLSESEWEYAARGGATTPRFWGNRIEDACTFANVSDLSRKQQVSLARETDISFIDCTDDHVWSAPVGSFSPNAFGLHDMLGNVWEWTADCFHRSYDGAPSDGSIWSTGDCTYHAFRGGAFSSLAYNYRVTQRGFGADPNAYADEPSEYRADYLGFRVARELE